MNTMTTLFGGLTAVLAVYAIAGAFRGLHPMLRALLAGLLPLIAYFALIVGRWPGLDVVAIHISVFLAAGLVLFAITQFRRRSVGRLHWVPKLLIAFFMGLVVINATLLYIANKGLPEPVARWWLGSDRGAIYSGFSGVVAHGQDAAKAVSAELSQAHRESQTGWQVDVEGFEQAEISRVVEVRVKDRTGLPVDGIGAEVRVLRPGSSQPERVVMLPAAGAGVYSGVLDLPARGRWIVELRLTQGGKLQYHQNREIVLP